VTAVQVARLEDLQPGQPVLVSVDGVRVVLVRAGEAVHALGDTCAHRGGPLSEGRLSGSRLACPWHGWMYDIRTGLCVFPGRDVSVPRYPVRLEADAVWLDMPDGGPGDGARS
jgi:nitrite reductase (NADH) small subunit/3-phenylpropionate/trans-cinnamate dioxygenase ferredoxin subunit